MFFPETTIFGYNAATFLIWFVGIVSLLCYTYGTITDNMSQVDRLWSILPVLLTWMYMVTSNFSWVTFIMSLCISLWGCRLTYNFYIKGGYTFKGGKFTDEDYRWQLLRKAIPNPILWNLFHIGFICIVQLSLITGFTLPVWIAASSTPSFTIWDYAFTVLFLLFLTMETIADNAMFKFQTTKYALTPEERGCSIDLRIVAGFNFTGLCKFSRHPNYFAEVAQWVVLYFWGSYHCKTCLNWGLPFALLLFIIVFCSTFVSEPVSASKYPLYVRYQKCTSRFFPFFPHGYAEFVQAVEQQRTLALSA